MNGLVVRANRDGDLRPVAALQTLPSRSRSRSAPPPPTRHPQLREPARAGELHELKTNNPAAYERKIKAAQFSSWNVMVKAKTEEYQGESRRRLTVMKCQKPDYAAESRNLLKLMGIAQPVA